MTSNNDTPPSTSPTAEEWFDHASAPSTPPVKRRHKRLLIVSVIVVIILLVGGSAFLLFSKRFVAADCFERKPYQLLINLVNTQLGDRLVASDIVPDEALTTHEVYFTAGTTDINAGLSDNPTPFLQALAHYYRDHHQDAPFTIQLESQYEGEDSGIALQRIENIKRILVEAGVASEAIQITSSSVDLSIDSLDQSETEEDIAVDGFPVVLTVTPVPPNTCTK